jgi:hypothetical protein
MKLARLVRGVFSVCCVLGAACAHTEPARGTSASLLVAEPANPPPPQAAVSSASAAAPPGERTAGSETAPKEPIAAFMADHFVITALARDAVISGEMGPMREPLLALANYRYATAAPGPWLSFLPQLQQAARLTAQAGTLDAAASGVATMARICGECHLANGGPKPLAIEPDPQHAAKRDTLANRMIRHMVATDKLWEGLTTPSDAAWKAGAAALRHAPTTTHQTLPPGFVTRLLEVRELGDDADAAQTLEQRSNVMGLLLATCADCHALRVEHDF